jgi:hypothetical protein
VQCAPFSLSFGETALCVDADGASVNITVESTGYLRAGIIWPSGQSPNSWCTNGTSIGVSALDADGAVVAGYGFEASSDNADYGRDVIDGCSGVSVNWANNALPTPVVLQVTCFSEVCAGKLSVELVMPSPPPSPPPPSPPAVLAGSQWLQNNALCGSSTCVSQGLFPQRCFSTAVDGWSSYTWHDRCNYRGPTLTVYMLGNNVTIASSISQSWVSRNQWIVQDWNARIYLLAQQVALTPGSGPGGYWSGYYNAFDYYSHGPTMGQGHDIYVDSGMRVQYCYCYTFGCPYGNICGTYNPSTLGIETYFWSPYPAPPPPPSPPPLPPSPPYLLYQGWSTPVPNCNTTGYNAVQSTVDGGTYPYNLGDSNSCRAWKLAATICTTQPQCYSDCNNFYCPYSGGFTDPLFGSFCAVGSQFSCSGCPGACNAACRYGPLSLRNCWGSEGSQS